MAIDARHGTTTLIDSRTSRSAGAIAFWLAAACLLFVRLWLGSGLSVQITFAPHDDSLYVERALHLLSGEGFGPYDSRMLVKYPGLSIWLAGLAALGIPYLPSLNVVYLASGFYLVTAFLRLGANRWVMLAAFFLYAMNPLTFGHEWLRVLREPLDSVLMVLMSGAMAHIFAARQQGRGGWIHLALFAIAFAFSMFVREENRLLWALLGMFVAALAWWAYRYQRSRASLLFIAAALVAPLGLAKSYEHAFRSFVDRQYGAPILHEFGEGEFPRLLAAIRSIESAKDNRLVMVTQERLEKLRKQVPIFAPVVEGLPKPGPATYSCRLQGVCSEWSNGWMPFWIKDEAFYAGLTPTLPEAQEYFRRVRIAIEQACAAGDIRCAGAGGGFLPPMGLRWTRAYVAAAFHLIQMTLAPEIYPKPQVAPVEVPGDVRYFYRKVVMADVGDTSGLKGSFAGFARALATPYQAVAAVLLVGAFLSLGIRLWIADRVPLGLGALIGIIVGSYAILRLAALTYVAVFLGPLTERIVMPTYVVLVLVALPFVVETISAWRMSRRAAVA